MGHERQWKPGGPAPSFVRQRWPVGRAAWSRTIGALLTLLALGQLPAVHAAEPDAASLEREIVALKEVVWQLQARVDRLERQPSAAGLPASGVPRGAPPSASQPALPAGPAAAPKAALPVAPMPARQPGEETVASSPQMQLRVNWSKIDPGMTADEVSALLGEPTRRLQLDGRIAWYYSYPALGNGSVFFTTAGRVSSHQSPFAWGG